MKLSGNTVNLRCGCNGFGTPLGVCVVCKKCMMSVLKSAVDCLVMQIERGGKLSFWKHSWKEECLHCLGT